MKISFNPSISTINIKNQNLQNKKTFDMQDNFVNTHISFKGEKSLFDLFVGLLNQPERIRKIDKAYESTNVSDYHKTLAQELRNNFDVEIPPENLKNIMTPDEVRELIPTLKQENFIYSHVNEEGNKTYFTDLDSNTRFSDGRITLIELMDNVASYADEFYKATGKDYVFAITDRDSTDSVQQAVRLIGENPEKYAHVKFIPALKMTVLQEDEASEIGYTNSEMIVYGVNPFSENLQNYLETSMDNRYGMILNYLKKVCTMHPSFLFNIRKFIDKSEMGYTQGYTISNLYWQAKDFEEKKLMPEDMDEEELAFNTNEAETLLRELDQVYMSNNVDPKKQVYNLSEADSYKQDVRNVFTVYEAEYANKDNFANMINCLENEPQKPTIAVAAPIYLSHYLKGETENDYTKVVDFIKNMKSKSNGMLIAFESIVPKYSRDNNLTARTVRTFNRFMRKNTDLSEVGGSIIVKLAR